MKKQTLVVIVTVAMLLLLLGAGNDNLLAGTPTPDTMTITGNTRNAFTYQGRLTDTSGKPLNGQYNMTFQLWDMVTGGTQVGSDIVVNGVTVGNGIFNASIPVPDRTFNGRALWLRIKVGNDWLEPRQEIMAVPYAMSLIPGTSIQTATMGDQSSLLWLENTSTINKTWGIVAGSASPDGIGVVGYNLATTGQAIAVAGYSSAPNSRAVYGENQSTTGDNCGICGNSQSPDGKGVSGWSTVGGDGVSGWTSGGGGTGVWGGTDDSNSIAINGWNGSSGIAILGDSTNGTGIQARSQFWRPFEAFGSSWDDVKFYVSNDGNVYADGTFHTPAADFAEMLPAHSDLEPGDVLIIGLDSKLTRSTQPYQTAVVGVYSTQPGFLGGVADGADLTDQIPLAIVGIVPVKVSTENGPIYPGDLLTPSAIPGYAMVCQNRLDCVGAIIGKALEPLEEGTGMINVLITLQ